MTPIIYFIKRKFIVLSFILLITVLLFIYYPSFFNAPRSDWWESFYFFHSVYSFPGSFQWLHILNSDCFGHVTFRPLSHLLLYLEYLVFGSSFEYYHLVNFLLYCLSIILLYRLTVAFVNNRGLAFFSATIFAVLFSHFDIVSWTAHVYLIFGFSAFLTGFLLYIRFLKKGRDILLFFVAFLFLSGMLCYEAFLLWPLSVIILGQISDTSETQSLPKPELKKSYILIISSVYLAYILIFLLTRSIPTYNDTWAQTRSLFTELSSPYRIFESISAASFNILYNGFFVNIMPQFACPAQINPDSSNLEMGGFLTKYTPQNLHLYLSAGILILITALIVALLWKRRHFEVLKKFILLFLLLFSFTFFLAHYKYFSNKEYFYNLRQFRFQYVPNALIVLMILLIQGTLKAKLIKKLFLYFLLPIIIASNIYFTVRYISLESRQLAPLSRMLVEIRGAIRKGLISREKRLYLDDNIVKTLPKMCWNPYMGKKFIVGTYQWIFRPDELKYFSSDIEGATWIIDNNLSIRNKVD